MSKLYRKIAIVGAAACMLCGVMSACQIPVSTVTGSTGQTASLTLTPEKTMVTAELTFSGAVTTVDTLVRANQLTVPQKLQAAQVLEKAHQALLLMRKAYDAGKAAEVALQADNVQDALAALTPLIPGGTFKEK